MKNGDIMKTIHYDAEGDILSVTFTAIEGQNHTGFELSDNIVLYYNPETGTPLKLVLLSYCALLKASSKAPISLDGLSLAPVRVKKIVTALLQRTPLTAFFQLIKTNNQTSLASRLHGIFTPSTLEMIAAS